MNFALKILSNAPSATQPADRHPPLKLRGGRGSYIQGYLVSCLFLLSACGLVEGGSPTSTGDFDIAGEIGSISIQAPEGSAAYKSIPISNKQDGPIQITNIIFANNMCGDFSLANILDASGNMLYQTGDILQVIVPGGGSVKITIRYHPTVNCVYKDYDTTLYVYYTDGNTSRRVAILLKPVIGAPLPTEEGGDTPPEEPEPVDCAEDPNSFDYVDQSFSGRPAAGEYFLTIDRMRSFIFTSQVKSIVGTDINTANFPEGMEFTPAHVKATIADDGTFTLSPITVCEQFQVPSATSDSNFFGRSSTITSLKDFSGTVGEGGEVTLSALEVLLRVAGLNGTPSLVDNAEGIFQVTIRSDVTTGMTAEDFNLGQPLTGAEAIVEFEGEHVLPISDEDGNGQFTLKGSPVQEGKMVLVGIGSFLETDFIGDMLTAFPILTNETSFIYLELDATFTTRSGGSGGGDGEGS